MNSEKGNLPGDAIAALEKGSKIEAIKCVRVAQGVGLKEAKEIVEQFLENNPDVSSRMTSVNIATSRSGFIWLLLFAAIALAVYYFLAK